jgi:hypothetical protein
MCGEYGTPERHTVTGIPPTTRAHSVEEHQNTEVDPLDDRSRTIDDAAMDLPRCDHAERFCVK